MNTITFRVNKTFCGDCMMGLRRFIQGIEGVASVEISGQAMTIIFDASVMKEKTLRDIARNSLERIGYSIEE